MAYTNIDDPSAHFQTVLYAGDSSNSTVITNDGNSDLQPDWVWIKSRNEGNDGTGGHMWFDSSRGIKSTTGSNSPFLVSNSTSGDQTNANGLQAIGSDSFTPGSMTRTNESGDNYVAWQWKANGGTTASNSDGTITSTTQVNSDAGFSIQTLTSASSGTSNWGHGLGQKPDWWVVKITGSGGGGWWLHHKSLNSGTSSQYLGLNSTAAATNLSAFDASSSTITASADFVANSKTMVCYAFAEKQGYSKFGKYVGNADANGPFVYTGFKPAFVMIKTISTTDDWYIFDNKRAGYNPEVFRLRANTSGAEATGTNNTVDHLSNGFKLRFPGGSINGSGLPYIYMAFAENPFTTSTGIPTTAR